MWPSRVLWFLMLFGNSFGEAVQTLTRPRDDAFNVVNVHCASDQQSVTQATAMVGRPGKQGPIGPSGLKGDKGARGPRGEPGRRLDASQLRQEIMSMLNVRSCEELEAEGVTQSGYYLMKANPLAPASPRYQYCDFRLYTGVSSCSELVSKHNITKYGSYRLLNKEGKSVFRYCPDPYTCEQLSARDGVKESGLYMMGPPEDQFQVYCNFFSGRAVTEVWHDSMDEAEADSTCAGQGCYKKTPRYTISNEHIVKIVESSRECRQYIKMRCIASVLFFGNKPYAWWTSRNGEKMLYWGGAASKRQHYCACGETGTCVDNNYKCNCDNNKAGVTTQDEGYLTDKSKLPVRDMKFGDLDGAAERAWHTLGKLECAGQA